MIKVPARYSYSEFYLTLRCNFSCDWCINKYTGVTRKRRELSAREWILGLNNLDTHLPLTFGGGEPTIHPGFYDILDKLRPDLKIDLLSNGKFDLPEFLERTTPSRFSRKGDEYKSIRFSYHPGHTNLESIVATSKKLGKYGYKVGIFGLNYPTNLVHNIAMAERCSKAGVYFFVRDFLGYYEDHLYGIFQYYSALNGNRKSCQCRIQELLVGPEGNVYKCHRDLYAGENEVGNILNMAFEMKDEFLPCHNFGLCNPCDIKKKLGPDLSTSKCSVEIKEL
jgi:hypothetical protein